MYYFADKEINKTNKKYFFNTSNQYIWLNRLLFFIVIMNMLNKQVYILKLPIRYNHKLFFYIKKNKKTIISIHATDPSDGRYSYWLYCNDSLKVTEKLLIKICGKNSTRYFINFVEFINFIEFKNSNKYLIFNSEELFNSIFPGQTRLVYENDRTLEWDIHILPHTKKTLKFNKAYLHSLSTMNFYIYLELLKLYNFKKSKTIIKRLNPIFKMINSIIN